ncbi:MAG: hypothetical protein U0325_34005 [Polyangiales bacterium]
MAKLKGHRPHLTRLLAFVFVGTSVASVASMRAARAQVNEGMQRLARQLMPYAEQGAMHTPKRVLLNGQTLQLATGTTQDGVGAVLDWYETQCARRGGGITRELVRTNPALGGAAFNQLWARMGRRSGAFEVMREGDERQGYVACLDMGEDVRGDGLARRISAFVNSGDLSRLGHMRYAYVQRASSGTRIVTVATDGHFDLLHMFPARGDAPGQDIDGLGRYPGMRRVLSAREEGVANTLGMYAVDAPLAQVRDWYRNTLPSRGWSLAELPRDRRLPPEIEAQRAYTAFFERGQQQLYLVFDERNGTTSMMSIAGL